MKETQFKIMHFLFLIKYIVLFLGIKDVCFVLFFSQNMVIYLRKVEPCCQIRKIQHWPVKNKTKKKARNANEKKWQLNMEVWKYFILGRIKNGKYLILELSKEMIFKVPLVNGVLNKVFLNEEYIIIHK